MLASLFLKRLAGGPDAQRLDHCSTPSPSPGLQSLPPPVLLPPHTLRKASILSLHSQTSGASTPGFSPSSPSSHPSAYTPSHMLTKSNGQLSVLTLLTFWQLSTQMITSTSSPPLASGIAHCPPSDHFLSNLPASSSSSNWTFKCRHWHHHANCSQY